MDHQDTIPSQLSPATIPSVLTVGDAPMQRPPARGSAISWLGWLAVVLLLGLAITLLS